jgi:hypothetical protein
MIGAGLALVAAGSPASRAKQDHTNLDESKVGSYTLPPVLMTQDGTPVTTAEQWTGRRRAEILKLYEDNVHGHTPADLPKELSFTVVEEDAHALDGKAHRKQIEVRFSKKADAPVMHLLLYTPADANGPVPVFLALHFNGNWAIIDDPGVRLYETWDRKTQKKIAPAPDVPRGTSKEWDVPLVLSRGYGIAAIYYGDIEPDFDGGAGLPYGVRALYFQPGQTERGPQEWGAIAAWSWGMSRGLDYLLTDKQVDGRKIAAVGQSRLGKTVLWAGARDPRFAMVVASCSGEGGAALSRRDYGENLDNMTSTYLYQFCDSFKRYYKHWDDLPVDAHMLISLIAPRPLFLNAGSEDQWSDPKGEFLAAQAASPVYALFGKKGLADDPLPALDTPILHDIAFHEHTGRHAILASDWKIFLDFADRQWKPATTVAGDSKPEGAAAISEPPFGTPGTVWELTFDGMSSPVTYEFLPNGVLHWVEYDLRDTYEFKDGTLITRSPSDPKGRYRTWTIKGNGFARKIENTGEDVELGLVARGTLKRVK